MSHVKYSARFATTLRCPWFWFISAGYILRILLMPFTGQHDVMFMPWMTHFVNQGHFNLYAFLYNEFGEIVMQRPGVWAPYPYGFYALTASWLEFLDIINAWDQSSWKSVWAVANPARAVFLLKAAYLPFDLLIGYILLRVSGRLGLALWAWSVTAIYTPFMMGQNDIYATAFATAGIYAAGRSIHVVNRRRTVSESDFSGSSFFGWALLSSLLLGLGATFKIYPLLLLPPLVLVMMKKLWARLALLGVGLLVFVVSILPFLTTPTFVSGVLLNPEGAQILREIQLFGIGVSPFLVGYLLLIGIILVIDAPDYPPYLVWFVGVAILALLFLWVPTPYYWLIWITPLVIGVVNRGRGLIYAWYALQTFFALTLLVTHRELGIALPIHLYDGVNMPNLSTALAITHPVLAQIFTDGWSVVNALLVTALLALLWYSFTALVKKYHLVLHGPKVAWTIVAPMLIMFLGLTVNLYFAKDLVSRNNWHAWQSQSLVTGDEVIQELDPNGEILTGIRLRFSEASPATVLNLCLYPDKSLAEAPLACVSKGVTDQVENRILYFEFEDAVVVEAARNPVVSIQIDGPGANIILPFATIGDERILQFNETALNGLLDISVLKRFSLAESFDVLVVNNVLHDRYLLLAIGLVAGLTLLALVSMLGRP